MDTRAKVHMEVGLAIHGWHFLQQDVVNAMTAQRVDEVVQELSFKRAEYLEQKCEIEFSKI